MSAPGTVAPPPAAPPPPAPHRRRTLYLAIVVIVVVVAILVAFVVLPALTSSSSGSSGALTYSGAAPIANGAAGGYAGGGWTLIFAAGIALPTNETITVNTTVLGNLTSYCTYTPVSSQTSITIPAYIGNRSLGKAPAWEFGYRNSSETIAIVSVINGHGTVLATLTGEECSLYAQFFTAMSGSVIDSSQAAADVEPLASSFLATWPNASAEYGIVGGICVFGHCVPSEWEIEYSTCAFSPTATGSGTTFNATVNALTGHIMGSNTTTASCGSSTSSSEAIGSSAAAPLAAAASVSPRAPEFA